VYRYLRILGRVLERKDYLVSWSVNLCLVSGDGCGDVFGGFGLDEGGGDSCSVLSSIRVGFFRGLHAVVVGVMWQAAGRVGGESFGLVGP